MFREPLTFDIVSQTWTQSSLILDSAAWYKRHLNQNSWHKMWPVKVLFGSCPHLMQNVFILLQITVPWSGSASVNIPMNSCISGVVVGYVLITGPLISLILYQINMSEYEGIWRTYDSTFVVPIFLSGFLFFDKYEMLSLMAAQQRESCLQL